MWCFAFENAPIAEYSISLVYIDSVPGNGEGGGLSSVSIRRGMHHAMVLLNVSLFVCCLFVWSWLAACGWPVHHLLIIRARSSCSPLEFLSILLTYALISCLCLCCSSSLTNATKLFHLENNKFWWKQCTSLLPSLLLLRLLLYEWYVLYRIEWSALFFFLLFH